MDILFRNVLILADPSTGKVQKGELAVHEGTISYVGEKAPATTYDRVIEGENNLILPGFKNAHSHSAMVFARSSSDDLPLSRWLNERIFPLEEHLREGDVYALSKVAILEYLSSGITASADMYYFPEEIAKAGDDLGFRFLIVGTPKEDGEGLDEFIALCSNHNQNPSSLCHFVPGFHAEYTANEKMLLALSKASHELKAPVWAHNSETFNEVEACKKRHHGLTPTEYMESLGLFDYGGGGYHCVYFSPHDFEIFQKHHCHFVSCPGSNSKLASGIASLTRVNELGINLALGTDGPGSNNALDMFYEMRLASVLQKIKEKKADAFDGLLALKAATIGGALALGMEDATTLKEGNKADIVMLDLKRPSMQPLNDIARNIVYSGSKDCVLLTMVNGKVLYEKGNFYVGEDISSIYQKAQEITNRLLKESEAS